MLQTFTNNYCTYVHILQEMFHDLIWGGDSQATLLLAQAAQSGRSPVGQVGGMDGPDRQW